MPSRRRSCPARVRSWSPQQTQKPSRWPVSRRGARNATRGACGKAGATTGEWGDALRAEFGGFRAPTGVSPRARQEAADLDPLRSEVERVSLKLGRRIRFLVGKPGLDGHSNGAEQIAARATDAGMDVVYDGIRLTPAEIVEA